MPAIFIEAGESHRGVCPRCGGPTGTVIGFAHEDHRAHSIYYLGWCEGDHPERGAFLTLSTGRWDEEMTGADRRALGVRIRAVGMQLADAPVMDRPDLFGRFRPRAEVLKLDDLGGLWQLVDHIVAEDARAAAVMKWVRGERDSALPSATD